MLLDKNSPIPLYYQLAELLRERIEAGDLQPGAQLPTEKELSEQAGVSRMTVRQTVAYLVQEGTLSVRHGVGTFVAEPKFKSNAVHLLGFTEEMMRRGGEVTSRVLEQIAVVPPPRIAAALEMRRDHTAIRIVRLRLSGETPLLLETSFVPAALCPGLEYADLATQSLYRLLNDDYALRLQRIRQTLKAIPANDYESDLFGIQVGTAMILLEGIAYCERGKPVEHFKAIYRGDRFIFELDSYRSSSETAAGIPRVSVVLASA